VEQLQVETGGVVESEVLQWSVSPRPWLLPEIESFFAGSSSGREGNDRYHLRLEGTVFCLVNRGEEQAAVRSVELVERIDGAEQSRHPLPPLTEEPRLNVSALPEAPPPVDGREEQRYALVLERELQIPFGHRHELTVELTDENGLTYVSPIDSIEVRADGTVIQLEQEELTVLGPGGQRLFE